MVLPNWVKIIWWALLLLGVGRLLSLRLPAFTSGTATPTDVVLLLLAVGLFLAPVFSEVNLFGLKLKQQVKELKDEMAGLRNDVRNSIDVRTQISPVFHAPSPPPDSQLPALEARLRGVMTEVLREYGIERPQRREEIPPVSHDIAFLFSARYHIEKELRRILSVRFPNGEERRPAPVFTASQF